MADKVIRPTNAGAKAAVAGAEAEAGVEAVAEAVVEAQIVVAVTTEVAKVVIATVAAVGASQAISVVGEIGRIDIMTPMRATNVDAKVISRENAMPKRIETGVT